VSMVAGELGGATVCEWWRLGARPTGKERRKSAYMGWLSTNHSCSPPEQLEDSVAKMEIDDDER
jgi:hypothetical protein